MSRKPVDLKAEEKPRYNPNTEYEWKADEPFQISGLEIDRINRALTAAASTPEFSRFVSLFDGLAVMQNFFKEAVEEGLIVEKRKLDPEKKLATDNLERASKEKPVEKMAIVQDIEAE